MPSSFFCRPGSAWSYLLAVASGNNIYLFFEFLRFRSPGPGPARILRYITSDHSHKPNTHKSVLVNTPTYLPCLYND